MGLQISGILKSYPVMALPNDAELSFHSTLTKNGLQ